MAVLKKISGILVALAVVFTANAQHKSNANYTIVALKDAVNAHNVATIASLLSANTTYSDAAGKEVQGKDGVATTWAGYFQLFPDYHMNISQVFANGDTVAAFGYVSSNKEQTQQIPASWKVVVQNEKIRLWQQYGNAALPDAIAAKENSTDTARFNPGVSGIGGIFFRCKDPKALKLWYKEHLHLNTSPYGTKFEWRQGDNANLYGCTQWSPFGEKTTYFAPSAKDYMINYRVNDLEKLVALLRKDGVSILDSIDASEYGKFIHILDCEQNKVELWEPKEEYFDKVVGEKAK